MWNYAQNYAMSDAFFDSNYGPTFPGHLNVISGNTHGAVLVRQGNDSSSLFTAADGSLTVINNIAPAPNLDDCGDATTHPAKSAIERTCSFGAGGKGLR